MNIEQIKAAAQQGIAPHYSDAIDLILLIERQEVELAAARAETPQKATLQRLADITQEMSEYGAGKIIDGIFWPAGYCTAPDGAIVPPAGKYEDFTFGYNIGYAEGLVAIKDSVKAIEARVEKRLAECAPVEQVDALTDEQIMSIKEDSDCKVIRDFGYNQALPSRKHIAFARAVIAATRPAAPVQAAPE